MVAVLFITLSLCSCSSNTPPDQLTKRVKPEIKKVKQEQVKQEAHKETQHGAQQEKQKVKENVQLRNLNVSGYTRDQLSNAIMAMASEIDIKETNAVLDKKKWIVKTHDKPGKKVNVEKSIEQIFNATVGQKVDLVIEEIRPTVTTEKLRANIQRISIFSTPLRDKSPGRVRNIRLSAVKLDFVELKPGEEFSFNKVVGKRTMAKGYQEAPIILKTKDGIKKADEIGGGVCQVSTTLFNAVQKCGLEITERHIHSSEITYAPKGKDATVYFGAIDFRFKNNRSYPIMLRTNMDKNNIIVKIYENRN